MQREFSRTEKIMMKWLSTIFDMVVIAVGALAMVYVIYLVIVLATEIFTGFDVEAVLQGIVLILIFFELFEIIAMYLLHHHVSMKNVVEIGVLAIVKELLIVMDLESIEWQSMMAMALLILVMGGLYVIEMRRIDRHNEFLIEHGMEPDSDED